MTAALIIIASWWINAAMDAIDHGKGQRTLYELWHILKAASYGLPYIYIVLTQQIPLYIVAASAVALYWWELIYAHLRHVNFCEWDDRVKIRWLAWLWNIKRHKDQV